MTDTVTILGKVATDPQRSATKNGTPVTNFRLASSQRRFDPASQSWTDVGTNWYSVAAFRQLAAHAVASLRLGDSVIVTGRLRVREWESNGKRGTSVDIEAESIGHDLRWGTSAYARASRPAASDGGVPSPENGGPEQARESLPDGGAGASDWDVDAAERSLDPTPF